MMCCPKLSFTITSSSITRGLNNLFVQRGLRPLHYAVYVDYVECVKLLIERGADVNATDDIGYTPIHLCARKGNIE